MVWVFIFAAWNRVNTVTDTDKIHWPVMMLTVVYSWHNHRPHVYSRSRLFLVRLKQKGVCRCSFGHAYVSRVRGKKRERERERSRKMHTAATPIPTRSIPFGSRSPIRGHGAALPLSLSAKHVYSLRPRILNLRTFY